MYAIYLFCNITIVFILCHVMSFLKDYPCCKDNSNIVYSDGQGDWGYENENW